MDFILKVILNFSLSPAESLNLTTKAQLLNQSIMAMTYAPNKLTQPEGLDELLWGFAKEVLSSGYLGSFLALSHFFR